ncbi:MAG: DUF2971 domain-containing protein [Clostridia bacterium]|nr:DUF2971 domain-containing protein [Clostridia bacterium]
MNNKMDKNQQNLEFLNKIVSLAADTTNLEKAEQMMHEYLLRNTTGGKLYKYCAFDKKGHTVRNIKSGILHCSEPMSFNDPFDTNIGLGIHEMIWAEFEEEIELIGSIFDKFYLYTISKLDLSKCSGSERRIITKIADDNIVMDFVREAQTMEINEPKKVSEFIWSNISALKRLVQILAKDDSLKGSLGLVEAVCMQIFDDLTLDNISRFNEGEVTAQEFAEMKGIQTVGDEVDALDALGKEYLPENSYTLNTFKQMIQKIETDLVKTFENLFYIGCLTTSPTNRLMWSHYADSHKGICIEYDLSSFIAETTLLPVVYSSNRPQLPWKYVISLTGDSTEKATKALFSTLFTKDEIWQYENEWRIIIQKSNEPNIEVPITAIYIGARINPKNKAKILKIAKKNNIPVKQMKLDRGKYDLLFYEL